MSNIQHLLEKQRINFKKGINNDNISDPPSDTEWFESAVSTIQQEILQAVKEKVEGMIETNLTCTCDRNVCHCGKFPTLKEIKSYNQALSDLSSWLEGEKK